MRKFVIITKVFISLTLAYFFANLWNSSIWSERYWTWINHLLRGQRPGLASDLELISALLVSLAAAFSLVFISTHLLFKNQA